MPNSEESDSKSQKKNDDKAFRYFVVFRPLLAKLLLQAIILYIAIISFQKFQQSESVINLFATELGKKLIEDVRIVQYTKDCPEEFVDIEFATFPASNPGCRCDLDIYDKEICDSIPATEKVNTAGACKQQDDFLSEIYKDSNVNRRLEAKVDNKEDFVPEYCECYADIEAVKEKTIDRYVKNHRICLKYSNVDTLTYLQSVFDDCLPENKCQHYFCKLNNNAENKCPIVKLELDRDFVYNPKTNETSDKVIY